MKRICLLLTLVFAAVLSKAEEGDSIRFSLLTCGAGKDIYTLFGHTAIRYENPQTRTDIVFNYGMFSFNTPHFILRFMLGETDYQLGITPYVWFKEAYREEGRDIREQTLNLTATEKIRLIALLEENYRPENRIYRYNFFFDNCATRPRDQIERAVEGRLRYADDMEERQEKGRTFRSLIYRYTEEHPWSRFGMDLCLGSKADKSISRREMMFVPFCVEEFFSRAQVADSTGQLHPLVNGTLHSVQVTADTAEGQGCITPLQAAWLLFVLTFLLTLYGLRKGKALWGIDLLLLAGAGISGCILTFLVLLSEHPAVSPNYQLFVFHPLHLLCLPCVIYRIRKQRMSRYMLANCIVLTLFILLWGVIPQKINPAVLPLTLCLLIRSAAQLIQTRKRHCKTS